MLAQCVSMHIPIHVMYSCCMSTCVYALRVGPCWARPINESQLFCSRRTTMCSYRSAKLIVDKGDQRYFFPWIWKTELASYLCGSSIANNEVQCLPWKAMAFDKSPFWDSFLLVKWFTRWRNHSLSQKWDFLVLSTAFLPCSLCHLPQGHRMTRGTH